MNNIVARRRVAGLGAGFALEAMVIGIPAAPSAVAAPEWSPGSVNTTVSSSNDHTNQKVTGKSRDTQNHSSE